MDVLSNSAKEGHNHMKIAKLKRTKGSVYSVNITFKSKLQRRVHGHQQIMDDRVMEEEIDVSKKAECSRGDI